MTMDPVSVLNVSATHHAIRTSLPDRRLRWDFSKFYFVKQLFKPKRRVVHDSDESDADSDKDSDDNKDSDDSEKSTQSDSD